MVATASFGLVALSGTPGQNREHSQETEPPAARACFRQRGDQQVESTGVHLPLHQAHSLIGRCGLVYQALRRKKTGFPRRLAKLTPQSYFLGQPLVTEIQNSRRSFNTVSLIRKDL
jgi:hypothetical protein